MNIIRSVVIVQLMAALFVSSEVMAKKRAVIVGISDYPHANSLVGPVVDAKNMHKLLVESMGYDVDGIKLLTNRKATRRNILDTMQDWLVAGTSPGDDVLFYFSGHGFQLEDKDKDEGDHMDEAIAPYDVAVNDHNKFVNMITDDEIGSLLDQIKEREVTVIIDSCHSGTLSRGWPGAGNSQYVKTLQSVAAQRSVSKGMIEAHRKEESFIGGNQTRAVWSAVSSWQKALVDFETRSGSVFTNLYIDGIKDKKADKNKDSVITRSELLDFIRDGSNAFCNRNLKQCKTGLTPTLETTKDLFVEDVLGGDASVASTSNAQYFDQAIPVNDDMVTVKMLPGAKLTVGQSIQVMVDSQIDGYLMIFDVRDSGEVVQLYPTNRVSKEHQSGKIKKNRPMTVPGKGYSFRYEAFDPGSKGSVYAIVSEDKLPENVVAQKNLIVEDPKQYVNYIATTLRQVWSEDLINRQIHWSAGKADYVIVK